MPIVKENKGKNKDEPGKIAAYRDPALSDGDVRAIVANEIEGEALCFRLCGGILPECRKTGRTPDVINCK